MRINMELVFVTALGVLVVRMIEASNFSQPMTPSQIQSVLLKSYNRADLPPGGPTVVSLGIYVCSFYDINERNMEYSMSLYFREQWIDPRLSYDHEGLDRVKLEDGVWEEVWVPDVYFRNDKTANYHDVTTPNRMMFLRPNGTVWYVSKLSLTASCPMDLQRFPLDIQVCHMLLESYGYTTKDIQFQWLDKAVEFDHDILLPRYTLIRFDMTNCEINYTTGTYPCRKISFKLKRDLGYYLIQLYLPSALVVILSWIAFWSSIHAGLERIHIGLLAVLTITTHSSSSREHLPEVSYITAMDIWMFVCLLFAVASLIQSAAVNSVLGKEYMGRDHRRLSVTHLARTVIAASMTDRVRTRVSGQDWQQNEDGDTEHVDTEENKPEVVKAKRLDKFARWAFPLTYIIFCCIYWIVYMYLRL